MLDDSRPAACRTVPAVNRQVDVKKAAGCHVEYIDDVVTHNLLHSHEESFKTQYLVSFISQQSSQQWRNEPLHTPDM